MDVKIKDVSLVDAVFDEIKMPASKGTNEPITVSVEQIKEEHRNALGYNLFDSLAQYHVGDKAIYDNALYEFVNDHEGVWDSEDAVKTSVNEEFEKTVGKVDDVIFGATKTGSFTFMTSGVHTLIGELNIVEGTKFKFNVLSGTISGQRMYLVDQDNVAITSPDDNIEIGKEYTVVAPRNISQIRLYMRSASIYGEATLNLTIIGLKEVANDMADINRDMGKYQQLPDVTLTLVESGKRIDKEGNFVADSSFNIGRLGAVSKGNIYELLMGGSDKMVLGTALFVSHTIEKIGGVDKDVYKPIYSAVNVDLPISTYAVLFAGEDYADVLVSYRTDVAGANTMKVARWGIFASIATQLANLRGDVDLKSFSDGYYDNMGVGFAKNLIGDGEATHEEFTERVAGGSHQIDDALAEYVTIKGNSVVKNQIVMREYIVASQTINGVTFTNNGDGTITANGTATSDANYLFYTGIRIKEGHKMLVVGCPKGGSTISFFLRFSDNYVAAIDDTGDGAFYTIPSNLTSYNNGYMRITVRSGVTCNNLVFRPKFIDLTQWYNGNVPEGLTAEDFIKMNPDVLTMPYTEPHVVNMTVEGVKTTGRNLWDEEWELGGIGENGEPTSSTSSIRPKNYIHVVSHSIFVNSNRYTRMACYNSNKTFIGMATYERRGDGWVNHLANGTNYVRFAFAAEYGTTYKNDIIVANADGLIGELPYEPHVTSERKWTETMKKCFPDGMAKAGTTYDEFGATKAVKRIGAVDLGSLSGWVYRTDRVCFENGSLNSLKAKGARNIICSKYQTGTSTSGGIQFDEDNAIQGYVNDGYIYLKDTSMSTSDISAGKISKLEGVILYYELAEPIVTTYDELNLTSRVWRNGMEEIIVPEGKESAPISADVIYQINAFKTIKANKQGIEDLNAKPAISLTADEVAKLRALINQSTQNLEE